MGELLIFLKKMFKKIALYSIAAVVLGITVMIAPIALTLLLTPTSIITREKLETSAPTLPNMTESYGLTLDVLKRAAQICGETDVAESGETIPKNSYPPQIPSTQQSILISLIIVASSGVLAALIVKLFMRARSALK